MSASPATPSAVAPRRIRLVGQVTEVRADGSFILRTSDGRMWMGRVSSNRLRRLAGLLGRSAIIFGKASDEGNVDADGVLPAEGPFSIQVEELPHSPEEASELAERFKTVFGAFVAWYIILGNSRSGNKACLREILWRHLGGRTRTRGMTDCLTESVGL